MEDEKPGEDDPGPQAPDEPGYRIGAVTRLTGIQPDTLRMWERRYQIVTPSPKPPVPPAQTSSRSRFRRSCRTATLGYSGSSPRAVPVTPWSCTASVPAAAAPLERLQLHDTAGAGPEDLRLASLRAAGQQAAAPVDGFEAALSGTPPPRRFAPAALARAAHLSSTLECECPQHLADIIQGLDAFKEYSAAFTNRSEDEAALHTLLHDITSRARALMENALARVLCAEGIDVEGSGERGSLPG